MRISAKGRYGLAALLIIVDSEQEYVPVTIIAEELGLSKIYLEQIFSLLRKAGLLVSSKGSQGGYRLSKDPGEIDMYQILTVLEQTLFEKTDESFSDSKPSYERALQETVFEPLDSAVKDKLSSISLKRLAEQQKEIESSNSDYMFYI